MATEITLTGTTDYNTRYPPSDARKGYVARITGREAGPTKYAREFLGAEFTVLPGDEGLYERQRGDKKGGYTRWYPIVLSHPEHGLILCPDAKAVLPQVAKLLGDGVSIQDAVEITDVRPSEKTTGLMLFTAVPRSKSAAQKVASAATVDAAIATCRQAMAGLSAKDQKAVLSALRDADA